MKNALIAETTKMVLLFINVKNVVGFGAIRVGHFHLMAVERLPINVRTVANTNPWA